MLKMTSATQTLKPGGIALKSLGDTQESLEYTSVGLVPLEEFSLGDSVSS